MTEIRSRTVTTLHSGRPHPRNRHGERYDFAALSGACPALKNFVVPHPCGGDTIDFSDPTAVRMLNRALLKSQYNIEHWDIPLGYLCPPVPSRADYIHHVADLLSDGVAANIPQGRAVRILDIGVGANCIYPMIGTAEYGWRFVGTDIDPTSIEWTRGLIQKNRILHDNVECRLQPSAAQVFEMVVIPGERFDASMCNPPFHGSAEEAAAGTLRKSRNLGAKRDEKPVLNFGGKSTELWCEGGEAGFVRQMIIQSAQRKQQVLWFTTLVSKRGSLPAIHAALKGVRAADIRVIPMAQGQKQSRVVAWTFCDETQRTEWRSRRAQESSNISIA